MELQDFLKELFSQESIEGFEIGRLEVNVSPYGAKTGVLMVCEDSVSCAKVVIVPKPHIAPVGVPERPVSG